MLSPLWAQWRSALVIVKPETVIAWQRKGFRLYWRWKSRAGKSGRPYVSREIRELIRQMSSANPLWGAPKIHGELLKLGIEISQATVARYMVHQRKPHEYLLPLAVGDLILRQRVVMITPRLDALNCWRLQSCCPNRVFW